MSELQLYFDNFKTGYWAHPEKEKCRCHGSGYALSEVDTWHECPEHHVPGQPHPEDPWCPDDWDQEAELAKYKAQVKEKAVCPHDPDFECYDRPCEACTKNPTVQEEDRRKGHSWVEKESALEFYQGPEDEFEFEDDDIPF